MDQIVKDSDTVVNLVRFWSTKDDNDERVDNLLSLIDQSDQDLMGRIIEVFIDHGKKDRVKQLFKMKPKEDKKQPKEDKTEELRDLIIDYLNIDLDKVMTILTGNYIYDPTIFDNLLIRWVSDNGHLQVVELLLKDQRVDPSARDNYAIRWASRNGHLQVVELLLKDERVDPSAYDNYAIKLASENGHLQVVELLLKDSRVDPSADDNYALKNGNLEIKKVLFANTKVNNKLSFEDKIRYALSINDPQLVKTIADEHCKHL